MHIRQLNISHHREVALACPSLSQASPAVKEFFHVAEAVFAKEKDLGRVYKELDVIFQIRVIRRMKRTFL